MLFQRLFSLASVASLLGSAMAKPVVVKSDTWEVPEAVRPLNHIEIRDPMVEARSQYLEKRLSGKLDLTKSLIDKSLFSSTAAGVRISAKCIECQTQGTVNFQLTNEDVIHPVLRIDFTSVKAWIEVGLIVSGGKAFSLNLYSSQTPVGIGVPGLNIGVLLFVDLVIDIDAEIDMTGGFFVELAENSYIEAALLKGQLEQTAFKGVGVQSIPVKVKYFDVLLTASLRVRVQAGVEAKFTGTTAVVGVYANIIEFVLSLEVVDNDCYFEATEHFNVNIGAYAKLELLFFKVGAPTASTTLFRSPTFTQCIEETKPTTINRIMTKSGQVIGGSPTVPGGLIESTSSYPLITSPPGNASDPSALLPGTIGASKTMSPGTGITKDTGLPTGNPYAMPSGVLGAKKPTGGVGSTGLPYYSNRTKAAIAPSAVYTLSTKLSSQPEISIKSYIPALPHTSATSASSPEYGGKGSGTAAAPHLTSDSYSPKATGAYGQRPYSPLAAASGPSYPVYNATLTSNAGTQATGIPYGTAPPIAGDVATITLCAVHAINCPAEFVQHITVTKPYDSSQTSSAATVTEAPTTSRALFKFPTNCTSLEPLETPIVNVYVPPPDAVIPDSQSLNIIDYGYEQIIHNAAGNETTILLENATAMTVAPTVIPVAPNGLSGDSSFNAIPKIKEYEGPNTKTTASASVSAFPPSSSDIVQSSALTLRSSFEGVMASLVAMFAVTIL
ncbi:hypothetical protein Cpir12675_004948 [Ceratocystis pirilliformis]|uniref:Uncharacterized protein n=1 Tax=Ceratocystis pirilliformis TaxID=259994 RepID=A0ABR3YSY2_9PEZI